MISWHIRNKFIIFFSYKQFRILILLNFYWRNILEVLEHPQ